MDLPEIADFLATKGGWGISIFLGYALWKKDKDQILERKDWLGHAIETTEVLSSLREVVRRCKNKGKGESDD